MITVYPDVSCLEALKRVIAPDLKFYAYVNDVTPDEDSELGDFTTTATIFATVVAADWTLQSITAHVASVIAAPVELENGEAGAVNVYGVICVDAASGLLLYQATRLDDAPLSLDPGDKMPWLPMMAALWSH